jgi:hypothetical protein
MYQLDQELKRAMSFNESQLKLDSCLNLQLDRTEIKTYKQNKTKKSEMQIRNE